MLNPSEEFNNSLMMIEEAYKKGLSSFIHWMEINWKHESRDKWPNSDPFPGEDYEKGWNDAIKSMQGALDCFSEDN